MSYDALVRWLHLAWDTPEEELRTLTAQQVENIVAALEDGRQGLLTEDEVFDCLRENGVYDLPLEQEKLDRYVEEVCIQEIRALADLHGYKLGNEEGAYPPARSN